MRILVIGAGGVGSAVPAIAQRRSFFEHLTVADYDEARARRAVERLNDDTGRFSSARVDASDPANVVALIRESRADVVLNAVDPVFNQQIFDAAYEARVTYLDMAMTLSQPHPDKPYEQPGKMLGEDQFAQDARWREENLLALVGIGVEPGVSDVFARYAADHLFDTIDEVAIRDGANLEVSGYAFAPTFSIWTTIEECLNPPLIWERDRGALHADRVLAVEA